uniref:Uncharacterized protein n=1 Tax=Scleropages formosus TaxID=113540 RepID=A0A8C9REH8_SCLFO
MSWIHGNAVIRTNGQTHQCTHLDSSTPALGNSVRHCSTGRVNHGHEANKAQVLSGEVYIIKIKTESLRKLVIREEIMAETCNYEKKCENKKTKNL